SLKYIPVIAPVTCGSKFTWLNACVVEVYLSKYKTFLAFTLYRFTGISGFCGGCFFFAGS
ncbi:MAG: hypothetical protein ACXVB6_19505, partial [Mucilaginibacter sp.]